MELANTLAYYDIETLVAVKSFIVQDSGHNFKIKIVKNYRAEVMEH
jgi:hypothetical protein